MTRIFRRLWSWLGYVTGVRPTSETTQKDTFSEGIRAVAGCEMRRTTAHLENILPQTLSPSTFPTDLNAVLALARTRYDAGLGAVRADYGKNRLLLGMNGQFIRASILLKLMNSLGLDCFVETGTKNGFSSLLILAQTQLRVLTCDIDRDRYETAGVLLKAFGDRCRLNLQDRREFLKDVLENVDVESPFFYLDAQSSELTLDDEIDRIFSCVRLRRFVVVIDDFRVPWDPGFVYDQFPAGDVGLECIERSLSSSKRAITLMCPSYPASAETGYPAGFALLFPAEMLDDIQSVVPHGLLRIARTGA